MAVDGASVGVAVGAAVGVSVTVLVGKVSSVPVAIGVDVGENGVVTPQATVKHIKSTINKSVYLMETQLYPQAV